MTRSLTSRNGPRPGMGGTSAPAAVAGTAASASAAMASFKPLLNYHDRASTNAIIQIFPESDPGMEAFTRQAVTLTEAGSVTVRLQFRPHAQRVARRLRTVKAFLLLVVQREDGYYTSVLSENGFSTLVR
jgi:hypothetical protein